MAKPIGGAVFRKAGKHQVNLVGVEKFFGEVLRRASPERRREALEAGASILYPEAVRRVPRDTGELESEVEIFDVETRSGLTTLGVGVRESSEAYDKAVATEYGARNYSVGSVNNPKTEWPAKSKPGATMPWLRPAVVASRDRIFAAFKAILFR